MSTDNPHIMNSGAKYLSSGTGIPSTRWVEMERSSCFSAKKAARNTTRSTFAISEGWKFMGPILSQSRAPFTSCPNIIVEASSTSAASPSVYL